MHVADLIQLVVRPFPVEAQDGNSKTIDNVRIDLAVGVVVRNHLAASRESDRRAIVSAVIVFQLFSVTAARRIPLDSSSETRTRLGEPSPNLDVISAREIELLVVEPPRHVHVHSTGA